MDPSVLDPELLDKKCGIRMPDINTHETILQTLLKTLK